MLVQFTHGTFHPHSEFHFTSVMLNQRWTENSQVFYSHPKFYTSECRIRDEQKSANIVSVTTGSHICAGTGLDSLLCCPTAKYRNGTGNVWSKLLSYPKYTWSWPTWWTTSNMFKTVCLGFHFMICICPISDLAILIHSIVRSYKSIWHIQYKCKKLMMKDVRWWVPAWMDMDGWTDTGFSPQDHGGIINQPRLDSIWGRGRERRLTPWHWAV